MHMKYVKNEGQLEEDKNVVTKIKILRMGNIKIIS